MTALKAWHLVVSHIGVVLIAGLGILAWTGWHREIPHQIITREVQTVKPGETKVVTVPVGGQDVRYVVTAPSPTVRVITAPAAPVVVQTPQQNAEVVRQANIVVTFDLTRDCVHPDVVGPPDPTCGKPVDGHIELVQNGAGFVRVTSPDDDLQTGPIQTQINNVQPPEKHHRFDATVAAGASSLFGGTTYVRGELRYHPLEGILAPVYVGAGYRRFSGGPVTSEGTLEVGATFTF